MIRIGIFGDLHGNLSLMYQLVDRFEQAYGPLDAILQVGDFGIWPDKNRIDSTTLKKIKEGKEKLGFLELQKGILKPATSTPCYFVAGNHEDYEYLDHLQRSVSQKVIPIINNRLYHIRNGGLIKIESFDGSENLIICGLGGIRKGLRPKQERKQPRITYTQEELSDCLDLKDVDILLTHDPPAQKPFEDQDLDSLLQLIQPKYHFFGHVHKYIPENIHLQSKTKMIGLANVNKDSFEKVHIGCFMVLENEANSLSALLPTESLFKKNVSNKKASQYELYIENPQDITIRITDAFCENIRYICDPAGSFTGLTNLLEVLKKYVPAGNYDPKWKKAHDFFHNTCVDYIMQAESKQFSSKERITMRDSHLKDFCAALNSMRVLFEMNTLSWDDVVAQVNDQGKRTAKELYLST